MENINFKVLELSEAEIKDFDLYDVYYNKFIEIYGLSLPDVMANNMKDDIRKYDILCGDSKNYIKTIDTLREISIGNCKLYGIYSNNIFLGIARVYEKENELLIPDVIFKSIFTLEEQYYLYNELINYLEGSIGKKVYFEIPHKEIDLQKILVSNGYQTVYEENDNHNLSKTFLIRKI